MMLLPTLSARIRMDRTIASAMMDLQGTVLIVKVQHSFYHKYCFFFFSVGERGEFNKLLQSDWFWQRAKFPIQLLTVGGIVVFIHFRKGISANRQSFAFFTLPSTINQSKLISIQF